MMNVTLRGKEVTKHRCTLRRYNRGRAMLGGNCYGYEVECQCGHRKRVNGSKREATGFARDHLREILTEREKERAAEAPREHSSTCVTLTTQRNIDAKSAKDYAQQLEALVTKLQLEGFDVDVTSEDDVTDPPREDE